MLDLLEMKLRFVIKIACSIAANFFVLSALLAQNAPIDVMPSDTVPPEPICSSSQPLPVIIEAKDIEASEALVCASGGVLFLRGTKKLTAREAWYDLTTGKGILKEATFTTCNHSRPDYLIKADEVTLLPNSKIHLRGVSLYIGRVRVLMLPSLKLRIGSNNSTTAVFPRPGFDQFDGFTLSQTLRLADTNKARTIADLTLTSNHGLNGEVVSQYGFFGNIVDFPGRYMSYDSLRTSAFSLPQQPAQECNPQALRPIGPSRLRAFGIVSLRQRTLDINNNNLVVYRQPDLGLRYIGKQVNPYNTPLDPRLEIYPEIQTSWGQFKEVPGMESYTIRRGIEATVPINLLPLGSSTSVQPMFHYSQSTYSTGDIYQTSAYAIDIAHLYPNGSFISGRYIKRSASGTTPFQFDNVDIFHEWQGAVQIRSKPHIFGIVASYNSDVGTIYDWEVLYGYQTDCLTAWLRWHQRVQRLVFDIRLINM